MREVNDVQFSQFLARHHTLLSPSSISSTNGWKFLVGVVFSFCPCVFQIYFFNSMNSMSIVKNQNNKVCSSRNFFSELCATLQDSLGFFQPSCPSGKNVSKLKGIKPLKVPPCCYFEVKRNIYFSLTWPLAKVVLTIRISIWDDLGIIQDLCKKKYKKRVF